MNKMDYFLKDCLLDLNAQTTVECVDQRWISIYKLKMKGPRSFNGVMKELKKIGIKINFGIVQGLSIIGEKVEEEVMAKKKRRTYDPEKYQRYLASRAWWVKREAVMKRCNGVCERCKKNRATAVHHRTYIRIYEELLTDLQAICTNCHSYLHAKSDYDPLRYK